MSQSEYENVQAIYVCLCAKVFNSKIEKIVNFCMALKIYIYQMVCRKSIWNDYTSKSSEWRFFDVAGEYAKPNPDRITTMLLIDQRKAVDSCRQAPTKKQNIKNTCTHLTSPIALCANMLRSEMNVSCFVFESKNVPRKMYY